MGAVRLKLLLACAVLLTSFGCGGAPGTDFPLPPRPSRPAGPAETEEVPEFPRGVRLTDGLSYDSSPCWSPDGTQIAYASYSSGSQNIWLSDIDYHARRLSPLGEPVRLTSGEFIDREPSWHGRRLVFSSDREGDVKLFFADADTGEITATGLEALQPAWCPRGERIAAVHLNNICVLSPGREPERSFVTYSGFNESPSWSPDGKELVFSSGYNIVRADADGGAKRSLTASGWNSQPDWCRTRDRVVFVSNRGGQYNLWKMNSDGSGKTQITDTPHVERSPKWSQDGRWVAFQADYEGSFDIWAIMVD